FADLYILTDTGAEVITGSTRMKAGTAHKMVLNMISTAVMIKYGRVYENYMIYIKPVNVKLRDRMIRIVKEIANVSYEEAEKRLETNNWEIKDAVEKGLTV
ncbi:MAG: N-acetylmuramic acid 6-phosphate etherase, partial [Clostridia bacterium]|nr:N-acetylmuramic acid 6-phosphate etherase [Clostridia bacterium]